MSRAENPAFSSDGIHGSPRTAGLTIREHFAAMAMQGLCANAPVTEVGSGRGVAKTAIEIADALLAELAKQVQS